jgi:hypothetical protein
MGSYENRNEIQKDVRSGRSIVDVALYRRTMALVGILVQGLELQWGLAGIIRRTRKEVV